MVFPEATVLNTASEAIMRKLIIVVGVLGLFLSWFRYSPAHGHGEFVSADIAIDRDLVARIDRTEITPEVKTLLDSAVAGKICGKPAFTWRAAFTQAKKKIALDSNRTEFLFVFPFRDCNYEIETWGTEDDCGVAWLSIIECRECDFVTAAALYHMKM
ncbi:MAG: hypothetical protein ACI92S_001713 [Planctomycetaceae bacterium]